MRPLTKNYPKTMFKLEKNITTLGQMIHMLKNEIDVMIHNGQYDQWYEDAFVQLIFEEDFVLYYQDVCSYEWAEVDSVNDLLHARKIHQKNCSAENM